MFCPVCEQDADAFLPFGLAPRPNAMCPSCGSLERHRLTWLFFRRHSKLMFSCDRNLKLLHIAPEACLSTKFRSLPHVSYLSSDIRAKAMVKMDLTRIEYANGSFDAIYCSHVLEHIVEDRKAISELYRVLHVAGWAVIMVPITLTTTYEDPSITEPVRRQEAFGQPSHVRRYGKDFDDRLLNEGFLVTRFTLQDIATREEARTMSLLSSDNIYLCTKS
jgi:SAM-dependent methyltransferase